MNVEGSQIGVVGLGTMGRNLALNFADRGFPVSGYDRDEEKVRLLRTEASGPGVQAADTPKDFVESLRRPRAVMMLIPAGKPIDSVIHDLSPRLEPGDLLIDGGNSHFTDTDRRADELAKAGLSYLGVGVSGGEEGARRGPSLMPGGPREAYERVRGIFEAAAARVGGEACVAWLGRGSAGHFVKMVHNGIEYGIMELIAETYDVMHRGLGLSDDQLHDVYEGWNRGELASYLVEITARIFQRVDPETGGRLVDSIRDEADQLGTGMWTSQVAMDLGVPVPTIDAAVSMRSLSHMKTEREGASRFVMARGEGRGERRGEARTEGKAEGGSDRRIDGNLDGSIIGGIEPIAASREAFIETIGNAFFASVVITYAQGLSLLRRASDARGYDLDLESIARIWRGGCIIRAAVLERIRAAYRGHADLPNLLLDPDLMAATTAREKDLRSIVSVAARAGIPAAAMMASLAYLDAYTSQRLPANLIQAQRDYFGAHRYRRIGQDGTFHTDWSEVER